MASRKNLKKAIAFMANEMLEEMYTRMLFAQHEFDEQQVGDLTARILSDSEDLIRRISHSAGKDKKQVKAYYAALLEQWDKSIGEIWTAIEAL